MKERKEREEKKEKETKRWEGKQEEASKMEVG